MKLFRIFPVEIEHPENVMLIWVMLINNVKDNGAKNVVTQNGMNGLISFWSLSLVKDCFCLHIKKILFKVNK